MKKHTCFIVIAMATILPLISHATAFGLFPGFGELIKRADSIVILRIDRFHEIPSVSPYQTYDCYIYQSLKGPIPPNKAIRLQLWDPRSSFNPSYAVFSNHLIFLARKTSESEQTEYRSLPFIGASIKLSSTGDEKLAEGNSVEGMIRSLLSRALTANERERDTEKKFLESILRSGDRNGK